MKFCEWEPVYLEILDDFGFSRMDDEMSVRVLKLVTLNSDLISDDDLSDMVGPESTVIGDAPCLESDLESEPPVGTLIVAGSAVGRVLSMGYVPDIVVTDLDGDIGPQLQASRDGCVTLLHAHGDNQELLRRYAGSFEGPVVLTTQSAPENTVYDFGGFTDGDRAACMAAHFGSKVHLRGFDFGTPMPKEGSDPAMKLRKLGWARRILSKIGIVE